MAVLEGASCLQHCFMSLQSHSDCQRTGIDPNLQLLAVYAPISMGRIILPTVSYTMCWRRASFVSLSQPFVTKLALLLSIPQVTHTRRCPTNLPHTSYMVCRITTPGGFGNFAFIAIHLVLSQPPVPALVHHPSTFLGLCIPAQTGPDVL